MTALATDAPDKKMTNTEIAASFGDVLNVSIRMEENPQDAQIENCERFLKNAAQGIMQLWGDVQAEKARRRKVVSSVKRKALTPA